jgi:5-methylcytosine-specific restriction endonuclease McrA
MRDVATRETRRRVAELLGAGLSGAEVARRLRLSPATVSYHRRLLGLASSGPAVRRYDWDAIQAYHDDGHTMRECRARFGFSSQTWHEARRRGAIRTRGAALPLSDYLVAGRRVGRFHLKGRLLAEGLKEARCEECGISGWRGRALPLDLHHVNGDPLDNRLENLQILCPNCHAQTPNFGIRNRRRDVSRSSPAPGPRSARSPTPPG